MSHLGEGTAGSSRSPPIERQRGRLSPAEAYSTATTMERGSAAASNLEGGRRGGRGGEVGGGEELGHHLREQQHSAACSPHLPAHPDCHCPFGASSVCQPLLIYGEGSICTTEQQEEEDNHQVYNPPIEEGEERTGLGGSEEGSQFDPASPLSIAGAAMGEVASRFSNRQKSIGLTFFLTFLLLTGCVALFDSLLDSRDDEEEARRENGESLDEWTNSDAKQYLDQFGYIGEPSALEADQVGTPGHLLGARPQHRTAEQLLEDFSLESLKSAIRRFQEFAGLPATGELDNRTKKKMKQPRCGLQDVLMLRGRGESSAVFKWRKRHLTYAVESFSGDLPHYMQKKAVQMAFDTWAKHIPLDFSEVSSHQQPDIRVRFARRSHGDPWPFDGKGGVLAHATFPSDGQLHFDDDEQWAFMDAAKIASYRYTDLFWVALHEIGHVLGLSHSKVETSIMAPFYRDADDIVDWRGNYKSPELTSDDIRAAHEIYGKRSVTGSGRSGNGGQQRHRQQGGPKSNREGGVYDDSQGGFLNRLGKIFTGESDDNGETAAEEGEEGQRPVGHWRNNQRNGGEQSRHRTSDWGTRGGGGSRVNDNEDAEEQEDEGMFGGLFTSAGTREGIPTIFCLLTGLLMALLSLEFFGI